MSNIKHLLFDCDGVLVDTEYTAAHKMVAVLKQYQKAVTLDYYLNHHSGTTFSAIMDYYFGNELEKASRLAIIDKVENEVAAEVRLIKGMDLVVNGLNFPKSVVSNSSIRTVQEALDNTSITSSFQGRIFSSEQVPNPKPAPDLYLFALSALSLEPDEVLVIEDSLTGAQAAVAAGLSVVGFTGASHILPGHKERLFKKGVTDVFDNPSELLNHLLLKIK